LRELIWGEDKKIEGFFVNLENDKEKLDVQKKIIFKKVHPKYAKVLVPLLIISFILAIVLIIFFVRNVFKPIMEEEKKMPELNSKKQFFCVNSLGQNSLILKLWI
jgi:hypothetical protein